MQALLGGEIEPVSIALLNPSARVVRTESGLFRLDLGAAGPPSDAAPARDAAPRRTTRPPSRRQRL
ncbi:MAG: hypothetical protein AAFV96_12335, partial [Pseudomonadota bacterium]